MKIPCFFSLMLILGLTGSVFFSSCTSTEPVSHEINVASSFSVPHGGVAIKPAALMPGAYALPRMVTTNEIDGSSLGIWVLVDMNEPEVHIPEEVPPEKELAADLPEPAQTIPQGASVQFSSPPTAPAESEPVVPAVPKPVLTSSMTSSSAPTSAADAGSKPPTMVITVRPGGPPSPIPPPAQTQEPLAEAEQPSVSDSAPVSEPEETLSSVPEEALSPAQVLTEEPVPIPEPAQVVKTEEKPAQTAVKPSPPAPPPFVKAVEPEPEPKPVTRPIPLPANPIPEAPARDPVPVVEVKAPVSYSRTVWATVGQQVEVPFQGTGWIYLGEQETRKGIAYDSRRNGQEGQHFVFRAEVPGTYVLKFYKQDFIQDYIVNDYVQVIVSEMPVSSSSARSQTPERARVVAEPRLGEPGPAVQPSVVMPPAQTNPQETQAEPAAAPVDYLQKAREEYAGGRFPQAIAFLDQFREQYPGGSDEAWWLYGQCYEGNSPSRDIRSSVDYYRRLLREYPQSLRGDAAQRRLAYLERYYFNIQ